MKPWMWTKFRIDGSLSAFLVVVTTTHRIPYRCCGDEPWLFRELWEKLFEDFCDVEQKKFDPSRVCERRSIVRADTTNAQNILGF